MPWPAAPGQQPGRLRRKVAGLWVPPDRRVIPRWRSFRATADLKELSLAGGVPAQSFQDVGVADRLAEFASSPGIWVAADLVGVGLMLGRGQDVRAAAEAVLREPASPPGALALARAVLGLGGDRGARRVAEAESKDTDRSAQIRRLRRGLAGDPRNAVAWTELALTYTIAGQLGKGRAAILTALKAAPHNRYVLRSAARFFVHCGELDLARELLYGSDLWRRDPWLMAAEIAIASAAGRSSALIKTGRRSISSGNHSSFEISELASALATVEMLNGSGRSARKLFSKSLEAPTENSVAQAEWASEKLAGFDVRPSKYAIPLLHEAIATERFRMGQWEASLEHALKWMGDQPFSSRPAILASFVAASLLEDFDLAADAARRGLAANPGDVRLMNNLAFALASKGRVDDAEKLLRDARKQGLSGDSRITVAATEGLVFFRRGQPEAGRARYLEAISLASKESRLRYEALARLILAREELHAGMPQAVERARAALDRQPLPSDAHILELRKRVQRMLQGTPS
jgi:Tfp pilus assembly protein PilF